MKIFEIIMIGIGLAMDAFAVSICIGLTLKKSLLSNSIIVALYFGFFQALMPIIGFLLAFEFEREIAFIDHWIAFVLLLYVGIQLLLESLSLKNVSFDDSLHFRKMLSLAIATSLDALAIGITFAFLNVSIVFSSFLIGIITFLLSFFGVYIGRKFGSKYNRYAQICGGAILIIIGFKILVEHLFSL